MVRLFHVYYPVRTVVLLACEALLVCASFLIALVVQLGPDSYLVLNYEMGWAKILLISLMVLFCSYYFDLYAPQQLGSRGEVYFRLLTVLGFLSFVLAALGYLFPRFLLQKNVFLVGVLILTVALLMWRSIYDWVIQRPLFRERVYVVGAGDRARKLVTAIRSRRDLGMEVVGWTGVAGTDESRQELAEELRSLLKTPVDKVIVAMSERRGSMPVRELLELRLNGVKVEDATSLQEKIAGKIDVDDLYPSSLIFSEGFRLNHAFLLVRRIISFLVAFVGLVICLPIIPFVALAVKLSSPGPVLFRQERVGRKGEVFTLYKFRTMRQDAEAITGAVWAEENDPRVTSVGRFLRTARLDEIPQMWNVLKGDMGFVGPRPERPEFVQWLVDAVPYYHLRHEIRPGITGWAQIRYKYGSSQEDAKEKLKYDLYYIKNLSLGLDLLIMFQTIKIVTLGRGAQ